MGVFRWGTLLSAQILGGRGRHLPTTVGVRKLDGLPFYVASKYRSMFFRFVTKHAFDRRTVGQTELRQSYCASLHCMRSAVKNQFHKSLPLYTVSQKGDTLFLEISFTAKKESEICNSSLPAQKFLPHLKCVATLPSEMQTFKNDTNYAAVTIKVYHVKVPHTCNHLFTLSQNLLKNIPI